MGFVTFYWGSQPMEPICVGMNIQQQDTRLLTHSHVVGHPSCGEPQFLSLCFLVYLINIMESWIKIKIIPSWLQWCVWCFSSAGSHLLLSVEAPVVAITLNSRRLHIYIYLYIYICWIKYEMWKYHSLRSEVNSNIKSRWVCNQSIRMVKDEDTGKTP